MKESSTKERLIYYMQQNNLKQVDVVNLCQPYAKKYNVKFNKSDISQYVTGRAEPNQDKLYVLSKALNVDVAWLMGYDVPIDNKVGSIMFGEELEEYLSPGNTITVRYIYDTTGEYTWNIMLPVLTVTGRQRAVDLKL